MGAEERLELERTTEIGREGRKLLRVGVGRIVEEDFKFAGDPGAFGIAEHTHGAGEFVSRHGRIAAERMGERGGSGGFGGAVEDEQALFDHG